MEGGYCPHCGSLMSATPHRPDINEADAEKMADKVIELERLFNMRSGHNPMIIDQKFRVLAGLAHKVKTGK